MRIVLSMIAIVMFSSASFAQMGHMMGKGMHDVAPVEYARAAFTEEMRVSRGGQLYDNWWKATTDTEQPTDNHPLWKQQSTNTRSGYATYRCKECHGWDYRGKDGAYGKGSHFTGFAGVYEAAQRMSLSELEDALRGKTNRDHDFSVHLSNDDIADLALFLKKGLVDMSRFVAADGTAVMGELNAGNAAFTDNCMHMCHGGQGTMINFGSSEEPEYVGTVAKKNPWEFIHKIRAGQPGTRMPSGIISGWNDKDIQDLLSFARTLPTDRPRMGWFARMKHSMGFGDPHVFGYSPPEYRGFGPWIDR